MSATGRSLSAATGHVRDPRDHYETPGWVTRAILPKLRYDVRAGLDPCCGRGAILDEVRDHWLSVRKPPKTLGIEIDIKRSMHARAHGHELTTVDALDVEWPRADLVITNPPYRLAMEFVTRALGECVGNGVEVAFLLRLNWLAGQKRASFHRTFPSDVYVLPRRPSFTLDGKTDATEYAWFVWGPGRGGRWHVLDVEPSL